MSRRPRSWRRRLQKLWEACRWYIALPGHLVREMLPASGRGWRRRVRGLGRTALSLVFLPFVWIGWLFGQTGRFLAWWWHSRNLRALLQGLPALLIGGGAVFLAFWLKLTPESQATQSYFDEGRRRFAAKDFNGAQICFERLAVMDPDKPEYRYWLALTAAGLEQDERAASQLARLAPSDRQGYGPAHLLQARSLILQNPTLPGPVALLAERHLQRALQADPESLEAHLFLADLYGRTGQPARAEPHVLKVVPAQPQLRLELAKLYLAMGNRDEARRQADQAAQFHAGLVKSNMDNHGARGRWVEALVLARRFPEALQAAQEGLTLTGQPAFRQLAAGVLLAWSDVLGEDPRADLSQRLRCLEQALLFDPANTTAAQRMLSLTKGKGAEADRARGALQTMLAEGKSPVAVHMVLGTDAWDRGQAEEARQHWEQALKLPSPLGLIIANNLAWTLAHARDKPDLPRALELIDSAVRQAPQNPSFRDTRGHILARMGRWKDAIPDLEAAVAQVANKRESHRVLAEAYRQMGNNAMAAKHEELAQKAATPEKKDEPKAR